MEARIGKLMPRVNQLPAGTLKKNNKVRNTCSGIKPIIFESGSL
jgi:hypothetical protein